MDPIWAFFLDGTELEAWSFVLLCGISFLGSFITAALGIGGGMLMIAAMALFMTPAVLIPLHGAVQLGSNAGRAALMARNALTALVPPFLIGAIVGAVIGGHLVIALPVPLLKTILATFIVYAVWAPKFQARKPGKKTFFAVGAVSTFTTMFVGATGPLIAPFVIAASTTRQQIVATHATLMTMQHALKIGAFGFLGFAFGAYVPLLICLVCFGFVGTYLGKFALNRLPENVFRIGLKVILTIIAVRLLYDALA